MNRRRMLHAFNTEVGEYEDAAALPAETDPQLYLSRNRQPQPFHLICSRDNVLSQLSGAVRVHLKDSSVNWFAMDVGDHVYIPAGTPHRIVPSAEGVTLRFQPLEAGLQGAAWYCDGSVSTATCMWFLAAARIRAGPPMSIFSMQSSAGAPDATVASNG